MPSLSTYHLTWFSLTLDVGYLFMAAPAKQNCHPWPWTWGSSSRPCFCIIAVTVRCQENVLGITNTLFNNSTREDSTHGHHQMVNNEVRLIIFFAAKDGEALYRTKTRPGADCGSDHERLIAKFRLKWKKVGKTTRPLRYDLNQIPYDYTVEVTNRFKGLDLIQSA